MTKTCEWCGQEYARKSHQSWNHFARSRFCSRPCAGSYAYAHTTHADRLRARVENHREQVIEDLEWIVGTDSPDRLAQRLGYKNAEVLARMCHRWGRPDLAAALERTAVA